MVKIRLPPLEAGIVSPYCLSVALSNQSRKSVAYWTVPRDSVNGLPSSTVQIAARSSLLAFSNSAHRRMRNRRCLFVQVLYVSNAFWAASTALRASSRPKSVTSQTFALSSGSIKHERQCRCRRVSSVNDAFALTIYCKCLADE